MSSVSAHTPAYDVATLTTCDAEPIHVPGAIQPHGVLLATDSDGLVRMVSANLPDLLGVAVDDAIGRPLVEVAGAVVAEAVAGAAAEGFPHGPRTPVLSDVRGGALAGRRVDVRVHAWRDRTIIELEPLGDPSWYGGFAGDARSSRGSLARLTQGRTVSALADLLAREIRTMTGFDRVMVYRFDDRWNGEVVAEAKRDDLNPFLGLHYPATDIPAQARRLYQINPIRLIVDILYTPVPLVPTFDPGTGDPLDLSHASLRSVSPIHVEYLSNMGVTASMSVSIMIDGELWGLVACHHYSGAHRPSQEARSASEFATQAAAALIGYKVRTEAREAAVHAHKLLATISARTSATAGDPLVTMIEDPALLELVGADGAFLCFDGTLRAVGRTPPLELADHVAEITNDPDSYVSTTDHLAELDPALAEHADVAAGVLRIGATPGRYLMWFRPEQPLTVSWGGDPSNKRLAATEDPAVRLSPRKSFAKWQETTRGLSAPWESWQLEAADALGRHMNALLLSRAREQIAMAESLQLSVGLDQGAAIDVGEHVEVQARYRPATTYQLGGDWWDAFCVDQDGEDGAGGGRRVVGVVGDVAGHGVGAASAMTQLRTALRAYLYEGHPPARALGLLDRLVDELLDLGIATALVLLLDPETGEVELAGAGHPMPLLLRPGRPPVAVEGATRPLLGVGAPVEGPAVQLRLEPGEGLLVFSDGLVEKRGHDMGERLAELERLAAPLDGEDDAALTDRLLATLGSAEDDTTLLVVRRSASAPPAG